MASSKNGKICYIELPTIDVARSSEFYRSIFGWNIREQGDGASFDDSTGQVSGFFDTSKTAAADPGFILSIMVDDIGDTIDQITAFGCEIVRPLGFHPTEKVAHFRDPGHNILGLYEEPS